jgi:delta 1-pyrroline-5-carboxylate dehydrogenase
VSRFAFGNWIDRNDPTKDRVPSPHTIYVSILDDGSGIDVMRSVKRRNSLQQAMSTAKHTDISCQCIVTSDYYLEAVELGRDA